MRVLSDDMIKALASSPSKLCFIYSFKLKSGEEFHFTSSDSDIVINNKLYKKFAITDNTAIEQALDLRPDNFEIEGIISSSEIKESDLLAGKFDDAEIEISIVNLDIVTDRIIVKAGYVADIILRDEKFFLNIKCFTEKLQQNYGFVYSNNCRAKFGGNSCGLDGDKYKYLASTIEKIDDTRIKIKLDNIPEYKFTNGYIKFLNGENKNVLYEIFSYKDSVLYLKSPMLLSVQEGDKISINFGCNKSYEQCKNIFNNIINFRGEPFLNV